MPTRINIIGRQFGKLTVIQDAEPTFRGNGKPMRRSVCRCDCGKEIITQNQKLLSGHTTSCGCSRSESLTRHGHARRNEYGGKSRTYICWRNMIRRCTDPSNGDWNNYGGRGIAVCERWIEDFENFLSDMGECPDGLTIDRVDGNGNYEKGNCKWSTVFEQNQHRRRDIQCSVSGITGSLSEVCRKLGIEHYHVARRRIIEDGWGAERALFTPTGSEPRVVEIVKHGAARRGHHTKAYKLWRAMVRRCRDPKLHNYHRYGGRGIKVCDRWLEFANFVADMGECSENATLRRKNTDGNYEPENCFYAE